MENEIGKKKPSRAWYLLALIPVIGTIFPSFYSFESPYLWGIPFFYWYQMMWVIISSLLTLIMYLKLKDA